MPGKVEPLRPAASSAGPPRTPEREKLAAAIARLADARGELGRVIEAQQRAYAELSRLRAVVEKREAALAEARVQRPQQLVDRFLGQLDGAAATVADAEASLRQAEGDVAEVEQAAELLREHEAAGQRVVEFAVLAVQEARAAVLAADPAVRALFAALDEAKRRHAELHRCCMALGALGTPPGHEHWQSVWLVDHYRPAQLPATAEWQAAVAALLVDPDAALPSALGDPPAAA